MIPKLIKKFAGNGEFSHYELINPDNGTVLWSEDNPPVDTNPTPYPYGLLAIIDKFKLDVLKAVECAPRASTVSVTVDEMRGIISTSYITGQNLSASLDETINDILLSLNLNQ
jgi:hypothetical protein